MTFKEWFNVNDGILSIERLQYNVHYTKNGLPITSGKIYKERAIDILGSLFIHYLDIRNYTIYLYMIEDLEDKEGERRNG